MRTSRMERHYRIVGSVRGPRITTLVILFALIVVLFYRARDPNTWAWLNSKKAEPADVEQGPAEAARAAVAEKPEASGAVAPAPEAKSAPAAKSTPQAKSAPDAKPVPEAKPLLKPTGPTDKDKSAVELEVLRDGLSAFDDKKGIAPQEMSAYEDVVEWVQSQSLELLRQRAEESLKKSGRPDLTYKDFLADPDQYRLQVVEIDLNIHKVEKCDRKVLGSEVYEIWGSSKQSRGWLYAGVVIDPPADLPLGEIKLGEGTGAHLVGYFFKRLGYNKQGGKSDDPLLAPMIIGRLDWHPVASQPVDRSQEWIWIALFGGVVILGLGVTAWIMIARHRKPVFAGVPTTRADLRPGLHEWLDNPEADQVGSGNNSSNNGESKNGHAVFEPGEPGSEEPPGFLGDLGITGK
jgi:hypothetical protein